jgi:thiol-disulfide isomerase/thioredoxin
MQLKLLIIFLVIGFSQDSYSQTQLKIGDAAPALHIQKWLQGKPVPSFQKGSYYVVEFSGTWCGPCRKSIPHLTELYEKYKNKIHIISVYHEQNNLKDFKDLSYVNNVQSLINGLGEKMKFTVAVDTPQQTTVNEWQVRGFPTCFLIDESGKIAWIGSVSLLDNVLDQVSNGLFGMDKGIKFQEESEKLMNLELMIKTEKANGKSDLAIKHADDFIKAYPGMENNTYYLKIEILTGIDNKEAYKLQKWVLDNHIKNWDWAHGLNMFDELAPEERNYSIEFEMADRAFEESETNYYKTDPLRFKAHLYDKTDNIGKAIETLKQALVYSKSPDGNEETTEKIKNTLIEYEYKYRMQSSKQNAREWLRDQINDRKIIVNLYFISSIFNTKNPDYDLLLFMIDKVAKIKENDIYTRIGLLKYETDAWAGKGNYKKAIASCERELELIEKLDNASYRKKKRELVENKITSFKSKL